MNPERMAGGGDGAPFPVYHDLVAALLAAHQRDDANRDATVAHVLAAAAGYAYSDIETMATIMARLGLEDNACVRVARTVDAMFIVSTAYLIQSRCGRVVILAYRGTELANLTNWLADADVGSASLVFGGEVLAVHSGFYRNLRATQWEVLHELRLALRGRSLANPEITLEHPMQALYVTGHSLGGAMAALFSLSVAGKVDQPAIADTLRAVYTFGQPMAAGGPLPAAAQAVARKVHRHVNPRDPVPTLHAGRRGLTPARHAASPCPGACSSMWCFALLWRSGRSRWNARREQGALRIRIRRISAVRPGVSASGPPVLVLPAKSLSPRVSHSGRDNFCKKSARAP